MMTSTCKLFLSRGLSALLVVGVFAAPFVWVATSRSQDDERRLWDAEFLKKRQSAKTTSPTAKRTPAYRRATPKTQPANDTTAGDKTANDKMAGEMLGVTLWRLRQSRDEDGKDTRLLLQDENSREKKEWTPERVESETVFVTGERVRLGIESPRDGFLYVIDREQYADGTFSEPYLIFPTLRNRGGDNAVTAGKLIEIPDKSAFRLQPLRDDYKGESLTLLITKEPLAEITVGAGIIKLDAQMVERWEKQWSAPVERFELVGGAGKAYTTAEKEAGDGARLLTQEDDLPQTLYRIVAKTGTPILITVSLRIGK